MARTATRRGGRFSASVRPRFSGPVRALWAGRSSRPVWLRVRARVRARLRRLRLFGRALVAGRVRPAAVGDRVAVIVRRNGKRMLRRTVALGRRRRVRVRFRVRKPGAYRAVIRFDDRRHVGTRRKTRWANPPMPLLGPGARGRVVPPLEKRLRRLGYHIGGIDRVFDYRTADAVRAFHKVQNRARSSVVREATWRALAHPRRPRARAARPGFHVEIDQTKQVLYLVHDGKVRRIVHTSTGAGGATRDGVFHVYRKLAGYSPNRLYYPSYFDGLRAIHGWPDVPPTAASHGCARVPMWTAKWIYRRVPVGTEVRVYH